MTEVYCGIGDLKDVVEAKKLCITDKSDVIVLSSKEALSEQTLLRMRSEMERLFPDNKVIILDGGLDVKVLTREDLRAVLPRKNGKTRLTAAILEEQISGIPQSWESW